MNLEYMQEQIRKFLFHRENSYLKNIVNNVPNFLVWKDTNSVFLGCNKKFADSVGLESSKDIIGKTDADFHWTEKQRTAYRQDEKEIIRTGVPKLDYEENQTQKDGSIKTMLVSKVPMFNEKQKISGILIIYTDITERKILEENLKKSKEAAEQAHKAKTEFVRNVSHDIRTPLGGIQQATRAISEGMIPEEEIAEYAYSAWEASEKLMDMFNQIIDVSRKEYFDFEDKVDKFDLHELLDGLKKTYDVVVKHKQLAFQIECADNVPQYLLGKHLRLHRVLMNLLGNALKFTEKGHIKLVIEKAKDTAENVILRFSVIDTGMGIPEEKLDAIFEPFTRLIPSFQGQYPGSGLGLHVVKDYVQKMQGEIYVESKVGDGSMFTCVLPFKRSLLENDQDVVNTSQQTKKIYASDSAPVLAKSKAKAEKTAKEKQPIVENKSIAYKVLLVEDDSMARKMGGFLLRNKGYQVDIAPSGEEAVTLTLENLYDCIYMDVGLPNISGIEATQQIRSNPQNKNKDTFITALTAHVDDAVFKQCLAAGMTYALSKPLSAEKLQEIDVALAKQKGGDVNNAKKPVIDFDLWLMRSPVDADTLVELFHILAKDFDANRTTIVSAYEAHDLPALQAVTHRIKGGLAYCGLPRLEAAITVIEGAAKKGDATLVDQLYQQTLNALDDTKRAYQEWKIENAK